LSGDGDGDELVVTTTTMANLAYIRRSAAAVAGTT
jgi:hypothetical protein